MAETVVLRIGRHSYRVRLGDMSQTNEQTGHRREIRRVGGAAAPAGRDEARRQYRNPQVEMMEQRQAREAARQRERVEQQAVERERVEQLRMFTGQSPDACAAALRQARGNVERAAAELLQAAAAPVDVPGGDEAEIGSDGSFEIEDDDGPQDV